MRFLPFLFSVTLFGSALLSFSVQPILGKMLLPMVGGAPAGWIVAMAFFQLALLGGYGLSYSLGRLSPWAHAGGLLVLYVIGFAFLPPVLPEIGLTEGGFQLTLAVVGALSRVILLPFLALTATTSALSRVFAATTHPTAQDPYYLFAASNVGSLIGLFAYPLVLERFSGLHFQAIMWQAGFGIVMLLIAVCVLTAAQFRRAPVVEAKEAQSGTVPLRRMGLWLLLAFVPCSLSMGVTTLITTDIASVPLFWVLPLGLYLLTFILSFARRRVTTTDNLAFWHCVFVTLFCVFSLVDAISKASTVGFAIFVIVVIFLLSVFFCIAWACHQRLADERPSAQHLPLFYFMLALGGGLAGILHAFLLPYVLDQVVEFSLMVVLSLVANKNWNTVVPEFRVKNLVWRRSVLLPLGLAALGAAFYLQYLGMPQMTITLCRFVFFACAVLLVFDLKKSITLYAALVVALMLMPPMTFVANKKVLTQTRNFFGMQRVVDDYSNPDKTVRAFFHGVTLHGIAVYNKKHEVLPIDFGYYLHGGPISDVLRLSPGKRMAVVGLGTGQLACFDASMQTDFYEIDADVVNNARNYFPYLKKCPPKKLLIGDGRLQLQANKTRYDVLIEDAFTSDGIPVHLLTREAFELYKNKLNDGGLMLFHISNRNFDLQQPLAATANSVGLTAYYRIYQPTGETEYKLTSFWLAVPMQDKIGKALMAKGWSRLESKNLPWTDDRSDPLEALSIGGSQKKR